MNTDYRILLNIVGFQLFGGEKPKLDGFDIPSVLTEAKKQTVFSLAYPFVRDELKKTFPEQYGKYNEEFYKNIITNTSNHIQHGELHTLMTENSVPYCVLKGYASAYYYPDPSLREMGDVDFLIYEKDFQRAGKLLTGIGFTAGIEDNGEHLHIGYKRDSLSIWEMHRSVNGVPKGKAGEIIKAEIAKAIETSEQVSGDGFICVIPNAFHHGLIMLLHIVSHLTSEGIGLRHLCDWAVFADKTGKDFEAVFEQKLKSFGLWKLAQILTLVSEKYLGLNHFKWAENREINDSQLESLMTDILNGGNFGKKDMNRYREIKYIANRSERTVDEKSIASQAFLSLNNKVYSGHRFIAKHKILLPAGWIAEAAKYAALLITGKRESKNTSSMLREAAQRKSIYQSMELFEIK